MPILSSNDPDVLALKGLHVYHANNSNCSMRVRLLLDEKGLDWISHPIDLGARENLEDWYLRINPKGLVPAIVDNGVPVTESCDILYYLEAEYPEPSFLAAAGADRTAMDDWVKLANQIQGKAMKTYIYATTGLTTKSEQEMEHYAQIQPDQELVDFHRKSLAGFSASDIQSAMATLTEVFQRMENRLAAHEVLVGDAYTLADIAWLPQFVLFSRVGFDFAPYPSIRRWAGRLQQRPAFASAISNLLTGGFAPS